MKKLSGMLPINEKYVSKINVDGWGLVGSGESRETCGTLHYRGCDNVQEHQTLEDHNFIYVESYIASCMRSSCPKCYEDWGAKESNKAVWRMLHYLGYSSNQIKKVFKIVDPEKRRKAIDKLFNQHKNKAIHVIVSVPEFNYHMDYKKIRKKAVDLLKRSNVWGGMIVFHPFRNRQKGSYGWYFSPHFHVLGFGWVRGTKKIYEETGWIIHNESVRKTVCGTIFYELSHAGYKKGCHTITWFGRLCYNKLHVEKYPERPKPKCPLCGCELQPLLYVGSGDPPNEEGSFYLHSDDWRVKGVIYKDIMSRYEEYGRLFRGPSVFMGEWG